MHCPHCYGELISHRRDNSAYCRNPHCHKECFINNAYTAGECLQRLREAVIALSRGFIDTSSLEPGVVHTVFSQKTISTITSLLGQPIE